MASWTISTTYGKKEWSSVEALRASCLSKLEHCAVQESKEPVVTLLISGPWNRPTRSSQDSDGNGTERPKIVVGDHKEDEAITTQTRGEIVHQGYVDGISILKTFLSNLPRLQSLVWATELPFSATLWPSIAASIEELNLDLKLPPADDGTPRFFPQQDLYSLHSFRSLRRLAIRGMNESYQSTIWETVWLNPKLERLELRMTSKPIVRDNMIEEGWVEIGEDWEMGKHDKELQYRGNDGRGCLHHQFGHGEYLDELVVRKARLAAGMMDENAMFSLKEIYLEGFVVDGLAFQKHFDNLSKIQFGPGCYDAEFQLPETLHKTLTTVLIKEDSPMAVCPSASNAKSPGPQDEITTPTNEDLENVIESISKVLGVPTLVKAPSSFVGTPTPFKPTYTVTPSTTAGGGAMLTTQTTSSHVRKKSTGTTALVNIHAREATNTPYNSPSKDDDPRLPTREEAQMQYHRGIWSASKDRMEELMDEINTKKNGKLGQVGAHGHGHCHDSEGRVNVIVTEQFISSGMSSPDEEAFNPPSSQFRMTLPSFVSRDSSIEKRDFQPLNTVDENKDKGVDNKAKEEALEENIPTTDKVFL